ncbi:normocyte-binding 1 [Schistosoma japonicum]|nr:normocyte-binding 1 [Schistosoma japonicum]
MYNCIDEVSCVQNELQNIENAANRCLLYVDSRTRDDFQVYIGSRYEKLDSAYEVLHTTLDQFGMHSIYVTIYVKQLSDILKRLCILHKEITKPITIDLINTNSNSTIQLLNNHDLNVSRIYQLREETFHLIMKINSFESMSIHLENSNYQYLNLIAQIKWKFQELNNLEFQFVDDGIQSFNKLALLSTSPMNPKIIQQYDYGSAPRRREFLVQYDILCKLFFEKLNSIKLKLENINEMFTCLPKQDVFLNRDHFIDSYSIQPPFSNVYKSWNTMKYFLGSYLEKLKSIETSIESAEFDSSILSISLTIQHNIIFNVIYCERQINSIVYLRRRVEHLLHEYDQHYMSVIDGMSKDFYSVSKIKYYIAKLKVFLYWINQVEDEFQTINEGDNVHTLENVYHLKEILIYIKPLYESIVMDLKQLKAVIISHLSDLQNRSILLNKLKIISDQHQNKAPSTNLYRSRSLSYTNLESLPVRLTTRKRNKSSSFSSTLISCSTEDNSNQIGLTCCLVEHINLSQYNSSNFFKNGSKLLEKNDSDTVSNSTMILDYDNPEKCIRSPSSESTSSTLCCSSKNEENTSDCEEISLQQSVERTLSKVFKSKNDSLSKNLDFIHTDAGDDDNNNHPVKDWTTKKLKLIEKFSSFIQEYDASKYTKFLPAENKNLLRIAKKFQSNLKHFNENNKTEFNNLNLNNELFNSYENSADNQSSILDPIHSPLLIHLNSMLKYFDVHVDQISINKEDEFRLIEDNLAHMWKSFKELIVNIKTDCEHFDCNMIVGHFKNISSNYLFNQLVILNNEISLSINELNKRLSSYSIPHANETIPPPNLWFTLFSSEDLLKLELIYLRILILILYAIYISVLLVNDFVSMFDCSQCNSFTILNSKNNFNENDQSFTTTNNDQIILLNEFNYLQFVLNQLNVSDTHCSTHQQFECALQFTSLFLLDKDTLRCHSHQHTLSLSNVLTSLIELFNKPYNFLLNITTKMQKAILITPLISDNMFNNNLESSIINHYTTSDKTVITIPHNIALQMFEHLMTVIQLIMKIPMSTLKELKNRFNKNSVLFTRIHCTCCRLNLIQLSNDKIITEQSQLPIRKQQQQIIRFINRGIDLSHKLMIWYANCHSLLNRWERLSIHLDWFNVSIQDLWNRLPETPMSKPPQLKLDYLLNTPKSNRIITDDDIDMKFISPIQVSYNILMSANSLDAILCHKSWLEDIFRSFTCLTPICEAILLEGCSLTDELLHLNTLNTDNIVDSIDLVHKSSSSFQYLNNDNNNSSKMFWNEEFKIFWDLMIEWMFNLLIEFNQKIFYVQSLEIIINDLTPWITSKKTTIDQHMKQSKIQSLQPCVNNLFQCIKTFNQINLIITDLLINEKVVQLNNLKLYIELLTDHKQYYRQNYLFYSQLINSGQWIIEIYQNYLLDCLHLLKQYQEVISSIILQVTMTINEDYSTAYNIMNYFHNWYNSFNKIISNKHLQFIQLNNISIDNLYFIIENLLYQLKMYLPILSLLCNLQEQICLVNKDCHNSINTFYSQQTTWCKQSIETLNKVQIDLCRDFYEYQQLNVCFNQLQIEIEMFNVKYSNDIMSVYDENVKKNFFTKYYFIAILNVKKTYNAFKKNLNSRLMLLKSRTDQFISTLKLTQINAWKTIANIHNLPEDQLHEGLLSTTAHLDKLYYFNVQLHEKIEKYHIFSIDKCLNSSIMESLNKFYQVLYQLLYLNGRVNFIVQIESEKLHDLKNIDYPTNVIHLMLPLLNEIQELKGYWSYGDDNDDDHDHLVPKQSIFYQFINYSQIILSSIMKHEIRCSICEYIQTSIEALLNEFTTVRLTVIKKLKKLYSTFQDHINHVEKLQTTFISIMHQLQQSKDIYELNIKMLVGSPYLVCNSKLYAENNLDNTQLDYITPNLYLINLAKLACQHTLLLNLQEFINKSHKRSDFSLNKQITNMIKLTDLCLCRLKHERVHRIKLMEYLQSTKLYSTGILSSNDDKLELYYSKYNINAGLINRIKDAITVNLLHSDPYYRFDPLSNSLMYNLILEHLKNNFMKHLTDEINNKVNLNSYYNCITSYLLKRFNTMEQNIMQSLSNLFATTTSEQCKFKLEDIIKEYIAVNSWCIEYIQLEPLFNRVIMVTLTIKSSQKICEEITNTDALSSNIVMISDWFILGIRLHQLKSILHVIMNQWIYFVFISNNVGNFLKNIELLHCLNQTYPQYSKYLPMEQYLQSFNYQEMINELKRQQILLNNLFVDEDNSVNNLLGSNRNMPFVFFNNNNWDYHNCNILNDIFPSSKSPVLCTICHKNPFMNNSMSSRNVIINEQVERLKALNKHEVTEINKLNIEKHQSCLSTLQYQIDTISNWIIQFIDETFIPIIESSSNNELLSNAKVFLDQLTKVEELLKTCHNEYQNVNIHHIKDANVQLQLDLSILLINCLQVCINQFKEYEDDEILTYVTTNVKYLIEQMKTMLSDDNMVYLQPCHRMIQKNTLFNKPGVYSTLSENIQNVRFKLLRITCVHNQLVHLCEIHWDRIRNHKDRAVLLRRFYSVYTCFNQINQCVEYNNNSLYHIETVYPIKVELTFISVLGSSFRQNNFKQTHFKDIIPGIDGKPISVATSFQDDHSPIVVELNKKIQSNIVDKVNDFDKNCSKEHSNVMSGTSSDSSVDELLSTSSSLTAHSNNKQLVVKPRLVNPLNYLADISKVEIDDELYTQPIVITKTFQPNSDMFNDLISQVKISLVKVERHIKELDRYHDDNVGEECLNNIYDDGQLLSTHLATSCDQLKKFFGQLRAYDFRIHSMQSMIKLSTPCTSVVSMCELNSVWRNLLISTRKWIWKLQSTFVSNKSLNRLIHEFEKHLKHTRNQLNYYSHNTNGTFSSFEESLNLSSPILSSTLSSSSSSSRTSSPALSSSTTIISSDLLSCIHLLNTIKLRLTDWLTYSTLLLMTNDKDLCDVFRNHSLNELCDLSTNSDNQHNELLKIDLTKLHNHFSYLLNSCEHLLIECNRLFTLHCTNNKNNLSSVISTNSIQHNTTENSGSLSLLPPIKYDDLIKSGSQLFSNDCHGLENSWLHHFTSNIKGNDSSDLSDCNKSIDSVRFFIVTFIIIVYIGLILTNSSSLFDSSIVM